MDKKNKFFIGLVLIVVIIGTLVVTFYPLPVDDENCAKEGERWWDIGFANKTHECCAGLIKTGCDTRISIGNECYESGATGCSGQGICVNCGNGVCSSLEDPCNCPQDCPSEKNADYTDIEEFCEQQGEYFNMACKEGYMDDIPICYLCSTIDSE